MFFYISLTSDMYLKVLMKHAQPLGARTSPQLHTTLRDYNYISFHFYKENIDNLYT